VDLYRPPTLREVDLAVIERIDEQRRMLRFFLTEPRRWTGTLRRATFARAVQGSNSIEGYHASVEDVAAVIEGEEPLDADAETTAAIAGYRDAMTYVLQLADEPPPVDTSLIRGLHFMLLKYDLSKHPGQWRPGAIWVEDQDGAVVYQAPDRTVVDGLVDELVGSINDDTGPVLVRAAMAHLNLTLIHPFSDGNGRMARCLQSYVLASAGVLSPVFSSVEEYLGRNTARYYAVLTEVAQGSWSPGRDTLPWIEFVLTAHFRQARTLQRRIHETEALWDRCEQLVRERRVPDRSVAALCDAARGWRLQRSLYKKLIVDGVGEEISDDSATRDLKALVDAGLLSPKGEKRGRSYLPTDDLRATWRSIRAQRPPRPEEDPYESAGQQPRLPGL
jgi:Fic family protein